MPIRVGIFLEVQHFTGTKISERNSAKHQPFKLLIPPGNGSPQGTSPHNRWCLVKGIIPAKVSWNMAGTSHSYSHEFPIGLRGVSHRGALSHRNFGQSRVAGLWQEGESGSIITKKSRLVAGCYIFWVFVYQQMGRQIDEKWYFYLLMFIPLVPLLLGATLIDDHG